MRAALLLLTACAIPSVALASPSLSISRAAAMITVTPEDRADIAVTITPGAAKAPLPKLTRQGPAMAIDGGVRMTWSSRCRGGENPDTLRLRYGAGPELRAQDLARIEIRVPRRLALEIANDGYTRIGPSAGGNVRFSGCGWASLAPAQGDLRASLDGSGDVRLAPVGGALSAELNGSGDIVAETAASATLSLNGSGDISVGALTGGVRAQLDGSGDVRVASAGGAADAVLNGSGDIALGAIKGGLRANLDGSGDIKARRVDGAMVLRLDGSGDIAIEDGRAPTLQIQAGGSGSVRFLGEADSATIAASGSTDVRVARVTGALNQSKSGSADISVGRP